jgi:hypothetical protein
MTEVPKIVYDRLRAARPERELLHPDADLLTAFAEQALSATERDGVLTHLAACGDCREVIATALPDPGIVVVPMAEDAEAVGATAVPAKSRWNWFNSPTFGWPAFRWAALAAGIAVAASILLLHPGSLNQVPSANRQITPPASALPAAATQTASSTISSSSMEQATTSVKTDEARPKPESQISKQLKAERPAQAAPASARLQSGMLLADNGKRTSQLDKSQAAPASGPPGLEAGKSGSQTMTESVEVAAAGGAVETESSNLIAQNGAPAIEKAKPAPQETEASEQQAAGAAAGSDSLSLRGRNVMSAAKLAHSPKQSLSLSVTWTIAAGVLQRSFDSGQNWQNVLRADHPLLCYASHDADIWVGGQAGTLYHSSDNGLTWVKVQPSVKAGALSSDITQIEMPDHVRGLAEIVVSTSNSEIWSSADGGRTWDKK